MDWAPVLVGDDAVRARRLIASFADDLASRELADGSLARGQAGVALLHGALARDGDERAAERTYGALAAAIAWVDATARPTPWLGDGVAGLGWALDDLRDVVEVDEDMLGSLDASLRRVAATDPWPASQTYWLWGGVVGLGVYALARGLADLRDRVVGHLDQLAARTPRGVTWWNREDLRGPDDAYDPRGYHNLGMALGAAGAAAFLAEAAAAGSSAARPLLADALGYLLSHERPGPAPRFPMTDGLFVPTPRVRNAWCYGDLAIASVAVRAGQVLGDPEWIARGHDIARAMARAPMEGDESLDCTLCCGTAGRAHLFHRLGRALDDRELLDSARRYFCETLDRVPRVPTPRPNFNTGIAGIGLALHAAISITPPTWDRALLIALPAGQSDG